MVRDNVHIHEDDSNEVLVQLTKVKILYPKYLGSIFTMCNYMNRSPSSCMAIIYEF